MAISQQLEQGMANARAAKSKQDVKHPFLIHREDGRLMPNTPLLNKYTKNYLVYRGDSNATLEERMRYLATHGASTPRKVTNSAEDTFDVGTATREQMVAFALAEYGLVIKPETPAPAMRAMIVKASAGHAEEALG